MHMAFRVDSLTRLKEVLSRAMGIRVENDHLPNIKKGTELFRGLGSKIKKAVKLYNHWV